MPSRYAECVPTWQSLRALCALRGSLLKGEYEPLTAEKNTRHHPPLRYQTQMCESHNRVNQPDRENTHRFELSEEKQFSHLSPHVSGLSHRIRRSAVNAFTVFEVLWVIFIIFATTVVGTFAHQHYGLWGAIIGYPAGAGVGFLIIFASFRLLGYIFRDSSTPSTSTPTPPSDSNSSDHTA